MDLDTFWGKVEKTESCWIWTGAKGWNGYGNVQAVMQSGVRKMTSAHRWVYEQIHGELPRSLVVDHLCGNKLCVCPEHLEAVTQSVNLLRERDRTGNKCPAGHDFSPENTHVWKNGSRHCRACDRNRKRKLYAERVAKGLTSGGKVRQRNYGAKPTLLREDT